MSRAFSFCPQLAHASRGRGSGSGTRQLARRHGIAVRRNQSTMAPVVPVTHVSDTCWSVRLSQVDMRQVLHGAGDSDARAPAPTRVAVKPHVSDACWSVRLSDGQLPPLTTPSTDAAQMAEWVPQEMPTDIGTVMLASWMLGISSWRRIVTRIQQLVLTTFVDSRFDPAEMEEGARHAYSAVAALAFGTPDERDPDALEQLASAQVVSMLRDAGAAFGADGELVLGVDQVVSAEMVNVMKSSEVGQNKVGFDIRYLTYESVRDCSEAGGGEVLGRRWLMVSTWRFEAELPQAPQPGDDQV